MKLWQPTSAAIDNSNLVRYMQFLHEKRQLHFESYHELWQWSIDHLADFWESLWQFFDIQAETPYHSVLEQTPEMLGTKWFLGAKLSYAAHIFRQRTDTRPAIIFQSETRATTEISWEELSRSVKNLQTYLIKIGVEKGDRVVAYLSNTPDAIVSFLAVNSLGAIWSCCSPDFGLESIIDRFQQIEPKVLIAVESYSYNGKLFDKKQVIQDLSKNLPSLVETIILGNKFWQELISKPSTEDLTFTNVAFDHPIWILYSSGTTGKPKAITHGTGGNLLEHIKAIVLHQNCKAGERFFWYSTTGWMMWNYGLASLLAGCTLCLYDGSAAYPDLHRLWDFAEETQLNHLGAGAAFFINYMKQHPEHLTQNLSALKTIGSTGSPLSNEAFRWIYSAIKPDVQLISLSGGTDVCSAFVGGCSILPVYEGEIQCRMLGAAIEAWNEEGRSVEKEVGELVITKPMPSMPIYFWNDAGNQRYKSSYFEKYPGVWCHGDWIKITENDGVIIFGRSDATLNRDGVRIGTAEIYSAIETLPAIKDSLVICLEKKDGSFFMPLFVQMTEENSLDENLKKKIAQTLRQKYSPRHVPDAVYAVPEIPYTISGKKMEMPIKKILMGVPLDKAITLDAMKNPSSVTWFLEFEKTVLR